jgi:flavin reductase (DIM6/NTAB) family NADH-FMN oxidoreductase RutF
MYAKNTSAAPGGVDFDDTRALRDAFGRFATGVCIASARMPDGTAFGITVNSFASVSLDPPLVLWCIQKDSTTYPLWLETRDFAMSVLNDRQEPICRRFALRGEHAARTADEFIESRCGNPVVRDAVAVFDCVTEAKHDAGDHAIIVARVTDYTTRADLKPLLFFGGNVLV